VEPQSYIDAYIQASEASRNNEPERSLQLMGLAEQLSQKNAENYRLIEIILLKAQARERLHQTSKAIEAYAQGLKYLSLDHKGGTNHSVGWFYMSYGNLLSKVELYEDAHNAFVEANLLFRNNSNNYGQSVALNNSGLCFLRRGLLDSSESFFSRSLKLRSQMTQEPL
jgi:Tfp pilus assembly protein PilF